MNDQQGFSDLLALTRGWCSRRERCSYEVRQRLRREGATEALADKVLAQLIDENFVDDTRYTEAFVSGHFRIKHWGKYKIKQALRMNGLSDAVIDAAIRKEIQPDEYLEVLNRLLIRKGVDSSLHPAGRQKIMRYAMGRGFEPELIRNAIDDLCAS